MFDVRVLIGFATTMLDKTASSETESCHQQGTGGGGKEDMNSNDSETVCFLDSANNNSNRGQRQCNEDEQNNRGFANNSPTTACFAEQYDKAPCQKRRKVFQEDYKSSSSRVGNKYVAVYWPDDDMYYRGKITKCQRGKNGAVGAALFVKYNDGDSEWIDPNTTIYQELKHKDDELPPRKVSPPLTSVMLKSRLLVWWPTQEQYYEATVTQIEKSSSSTWFKLHYDDGDQEWTDLSNRNFVFEE